MVLDMPLLDTRQKDRDLTGRLISDIILQLLSYCSERERIAIRQRQAEGIAAAKARGVAFGRPTKGVPDNRFMVDRADAVIAVYDGRRHGRTYQTICYAVITKGQFCKGSKRPCTAVSSLYIYAMKKSLVAHLTLIPRPKPCEQLLVACCKISG